MFVCVSLSINVCMFTVSNALLMSNATVMVRVGGMGWLKPVATVLLRKQQSTEEASTPNIGRGAETKSKTTMYSLTTTVRTLPSIAGLQA